MRLAKPVEPVGDVVRTSRIGGNFRAAGTGAVEGARGPGGDVAGDGEGDGCVCFLQSDELSFVSEVGE